jgi:hypothetical protein
MRKVLFTTLLLLAATLTASAATYKYMVFEANDGTQLSMTSDGLKLVYNDGTLTAISGDVSRTFTVSDLNRMFFSETMQGSDATAIQEISVATTPGDASSDYSDYEVYDLSGRRIPTSGTQLKPGLYIFKKGNTTTKRYIK